MYTYIYLHTHVYICMHASLSLYIGICGPVNTLEKNSHGPGSRDAISFETVSRSFPVRTASWSS